MLTEDIDSTFRALSSGARIKYMLEVQSYETAPVTTSALIRQRLRWAQGWAQVTIRHAGPSLRYGTHGTRVKSRAGIFFLLIFREVFFYFMSQLTCLLLANLVTNPPRTWSALYSSLTGFKISVWLLVFSYVCIATTTCITIRNKSEFTQSWAIVTFGVISPLYFTIVTVASIFCHFREVTRYEKWNPTARAAPKTPTSNRSLDPSLSSMREARRGAPRSYDPSLLSVVEERSGAERTDGRGEERRPSV